jgi:hypothetical protein
VNKNAAPVTVPITPVPNQPAASLLAAAIDELGAIDAKLAPFRTLISRETALRTAIRVAHEGAAADVEITAHGTRYDAILGPKGSVSVIDFARLAKIVKPTQYAKFATCTLSAMRANCDAATCEIVTSIEKTGSRSLKTFERLAP